MSFPDLLPRPPLWLPNQPLSVSPIYPPGRPYRSSLSPCAFSSRSHQVSVWDYRLHLTITLYSPVVCFMSLPSAMELGFFCLCWKLLILMGSRILFVLSEILQGEGSQSSYAQLTSLLFLLSHLLCRVHT